MGIDVGKSGAFVGVTEDGQIHFRRTMPTIGGVVDPSEIFNLLAALKLAARSHGFGTLVAWLEKAQAMPKQGVSSMFRYGVGFGYLEMALVGNQIPYELVTPQSWQKEMFKGTETKMKPKDRAKIVVQRLKPEDDFRGTPRCKTMHEGLVDAYLIAEACRRKSFGLKESA